MTMTLYRNFLFPLLRQFDAERMHDLTLAGLSLAQGHRAGRLLLRQIAGHIRHRPVQCLGLTFPNVLGVAAGYDKDARVPLGLALLGFGHVEVGTVTPWPQAGNPRPRVFRLPEDKALVNRMGFPNQGVAGAVGRLRALRRRPRSFVVGVSLGKQKETPLAEAADDYVTAMRAVYPYADYLAVNVSSPNTPGLRDLQGDRYLERLLERLTAENRKLANDARPRPLLLKISPDLSPPELDAILAAALAHDVSGIIATNTTVSRPELAHRNRVESGGLSGAPLAARSEEIIAAIRQRAGKSLPIIGVGGVLCAADVRRKLDAGASLVQIYTGLVYKGPGLAGRLLRALGDDF